MQKIKRTICFWGRWLALVSIVMTATNAMLWAHLCSDSPQQCHHESHDGDDKSEHSHQHNQCRTCQLLMGPGNTYLAIEYISATSVFEQALFAFYFNSQVICRHETDLLAARAPPAI